MSDTWRSPIDLEGVEQTVRARLRALRRQAGWSLDDLAARSNLSASVISRVETGRRALTLDVLLVLAQALMVDLDALLDIRREDDVVLRPTPTRRGDATTWLLSRPTSTTLAMKVRLVPTDQPPPLRVHPGRDWIYVLSGRVRLRLGEEDLLVETGEAAEFDTLTPHVFLADGGPAELIAIYDRAGHEAHLVAGDDPQDRTSGG